MARDHGDYHPRFIASARSVTTIACAEAGPTVLYVEFASVRRLNHALTSASMDLPQHWCSIGRGLLDGDLLDPGQLRSLCDQVAGRFFVIEKVSPGATSSDRRCKPLLGETYGLSAAEARRFQQRVEAMNREIARTGGSCISMTLRKRVHHP
jgi:hypothetical protein